MADKKEKKYLIDNPTLMAEWNWEKNNELGLDPKTLTCGSGKKVWWKCSKGHEWQTTIHNRNNGNACPYCYGRYAIKGENDLRTINPLLASEWNYEKNGNLRPEDFMVSSGKKVWWKCSKGHEWQAIIASRNKGSGCPICAGKKVVQGYNDLATINPVLAKEWNYEKNGNLRPENITSGSNKRAWWKCSKGHEWQAVIYTRNNGIGCPYCLNKNVLRGCNDLTTINPELAKEWNYEKNGDLKPEDFTANSGKNVWWKCGKGHEWQAIIRNRNKGNGCPICNSERNTSFPEYAIVYYLEKNGVKTIHSYKEKGYELDIYIPLKNIAIEYDGYFWHKNKTKMDLAKNLNCKNDGIKLYRIREGLSPLNDTSRDYIVDKNQEDLGKVIQKVLSEIVGFSIDIDLKRDNIEIENLREYTEKENSLLTTNPKLAKEWNHERNGSLRPEHILANSGKKVWWKCSKGHEWQATINTRNKGTGCPYCSGKKVLKGFNDLTTINSKLASEWNHEKNDNIKPENFTANSGKKVWWKCEKGHEWQATIGDRNTGKGCPYCSNQKVLKGYNDLETVNPKLAREWNYEKNGDLKPEDFTANSNKKVWWKCNKGHEWQAIIYSRNHGTGCPYCSGRKKEK